MCLCLKEIEWIRRLVQVHGGDINSQISPPSGIMENCEGTTGVVSLFRELLILVIPIDRFLSR